MNKFLKILIGAIAIILIIILFSFLSQKIADRGEDIKPQPIVTSGEITTKLSEVKRPVDEKILFPFLAPNNQNIVYYSENDRAICQLNIRNNQRIILQKFKSINKVNQFIYSENFNYIIIQAEKNNGDFLNLLFNFRTRTIKELSKNINNVSISLNEALIGYHGLGETDGYIGYSKINGGDPVELKRVECDSCLVNWLSPDEIYYYPFLSEIGATSAYKINIKNKESATIIDNIGAVRFFNTKGLVEIYHEKSQSYTLGTVNSNGSGLKDFNIQGSVENAAWLNNQDSFIVVDVDGNFFIVNVDKNQVVKIKIQNPKKLTLSPQNLMISANNKILYFTSDDILYKIELP